MDVLKINFVDFWPGFKSKDNYLYNLLSKYFKLEICDTPNILFYSCYGDSYLKFNCIRIFYSSENLRPDFTGCDFAMTFDYLDDNRHFRLPLYAFYIDQRDKWSDLLKIKSRELAPKFWLQKTKFCCIVVSNSLSKKRIEFFKKIK
ncbi:MAG: hypothetical protein IPF93_16620 [Saprospiraceae bacterium]|nr:hypothetical protein [Saprospiraceae bacterium]